MTVTNKPYETMNCAISIKRSLIRATGVFLRYSDPCVMVSMVKNSWPELYKHSMEKYRVVFGIADGAGSFIFA